MFEPKLIMVPVDGSPLSEEVIPAAISMAQKYDAGILLVHVAETGKAQAALSTTGGTYAAWDPDLMEDLAEAEIAEGKEVLREIAQQLRDQDVRVRTLLLQGNIHDAITEAAHEENVDLIAIATHGRAGLSRTFMGSLSDHLIREAGVPVLVVTGEAPDEA